MLGHTRSHGWRHVQAQVDSTEVIIQETQDYGQCVIFYFFAEISK